MSLDIAMMIAYYMAMEKINVAEFKNNISKILVSVEKGQRVTICKRNVPIANIVPIAHKDKVNRTQLGCGKGSVRIKDDLTEPMIAEGHWEMLKK